MAEGSPPRLTSGSPSRSPSASPSPYQTPQPTSSPSAYNTPQATATPSRTLSASPSPAAQPHTPSPPGSARTSSPVQGSGSAHSHSSIPRSHQTQTPVSPQYTFGGHTPISPQSFASSTTATGVMPTHLAVPETAELSVVEEGEREIELRSPSPEPQEPVQQDEGDGGDNGLASSSATHGDEPQRSRTPESPSATMARTPTNRSRHSDRSSWQQSPAQQSPAHSSAAINIAHKQRVSQAPPLPDKPYAAPPSVVNRPLTPTGATSLLAAAASSLATPTMSATRLSVSTTASSVRRKSASARARSPLGDDGREFPPVPPLPAGVTFTPSAGPSAAAELKAAIDAGAAPPHYSFLDQDPTETEENSPPHGGIMTFSGGDRRASSASALVQGSSPHSSNSQRKHLSFQSQQSEAFGYGGYGTSSSMAEAGDSVSGSSTTASAPAGGNGAGIAKPDRSATRLSAQSYRDQWSSFAGGPAPAWGRRESNRFSVKSFKSARSNKSSRNGKRKSNNGGNGNGNGHGSGSGSGGSVDDWVDDDEADLMALVRRAAVLERLLRHGKRASNITGNPKMVQRYSHWSVASTALSMSHYGPSRNGYNSRSRSGSPAEKLSQTPPRRSGSSATTHHSKRSVTSSFRHRLQRRLGMRGGGRDFTEVGSDDGAEATEPDMTVEGIEDDSSTSIRTPQTPIRRVFSSSFSRDHTTTPPPGAGAGIIVFPELAALPPLELPRHDGEVCAQACLPPTVAVPYTPLPPPPDTKRHSRSTKGSKQSKHSRTHSASSDAAHGTGTAPATGRSGMGIPQRSLHSLKNLRSAFDEKAGGGFSDNRTSVHSGTVLFGDVPTCDQRLGFRRARKMRILAAIACLIGIILIVGLLAGLLTRRARNG